MIDSENFISEIKKILNNYKKYTKLLANNFNEYDKYSFMNDMQIKMLISYLKKILNLYNIYHFQILI